MPKSSGKGSGGGALVAGTTVVTGATAGSVFFAGTSGVIQQDNANFFFDDPTNALQIGATAVGGGSLRLGAPYGAVGKVISSLNDGNDVLTIGVPTRLRFTDANGNNPWEILPTGNFALNRTVTPAGTTGARTINLPAGTVNIAAAGTSVVVTNSLVTTSSIIFCVLRTADATATFIKSVVPAAGSFTITVNAGATAEISIGFWVTN